MALLAALLLFGVAARAEDQRLDLSGLQAVVDEAGEDISLSDIAAALMGGSEAPFDAEYALKWAADRIAGQVKALIPDLTGLSAVVMLWALAGRLTPGSNGRYVGFACASLTVLSMLRLYGAALKLCGGAVKQLMALTDALAPVLVSMLVISGGTHTAALITPMGALISRVLALAVQKSALTLASTSAALSAGAALGALKLDRLTKFVNAALKWLLKTAVGAYLGLMATGGLISGAYDGALLKGARRAADSLLPIIGGEVAGMMDSLAASVTLLRGGAGLAAAAALLAVSLTPVVHCAALSLFTRFLAAAAEPVGEERALRLLDAFSEVFGYLTATVAAAAALILILIGAALGMGQRIAG